VTGNWFERHSMPVFGGALLAVVLLTMGGC